jgi:hypothetical protein
MNIQNTLLLITGLINLLMSIIVISRGARNKINVYFSLMTFFYFLWAEGLFIGRTLNSGMFWYYAGAIFVYPAALGIIISLFYFSLNFPIRVKNIKKSFHYILLLLAILISIIVYIPNYFILNFSKSIHEYTLFVFQPTYILYSIYFIVLALLSIYNFLYKYNSLESLFKKRIRFLMITVIIGLIFGSYFDLILCYSANYKYTWLGPLFTLPINVVALYLIYSKKE